MKILPGVVACWLLMPCAIRAQNPAPGGEPAKMPNGSIQLWNGHDLTGWVSFFKAGPDRPLHFWTANGDSLSLYAMPSGYLRTEKSFSDYHLHAEWRWTGPIKPNNNSGIFVMQKSPDKVWPYSVQVQLKIGSAGDLIAQGGLTFTPGNTNLTLKKMAPANEKPAGHWNSIEIYCRGASIEVFVNGLRQNFVDKLPASSGQIALQMEGYPVEFRNLWLQQL